MRLAWTEDAKRDLTDIRDYSIGRWGRKIASDYVAEIVVCARTCARDPARLRSYNDAYRYARAGTHVVFFCVDADGARLTVVRILHQSMDVGRHLPDPDDA
jgi:plasmid stabilization system protein ParE